MIGRARWILIGTAMMLVAGALSWSCGGGGGQSCVTNLSGIPTNVCGVPNPPGPYLQSISICPGPPPPPTPVPSSSVSPSATPTETACPAPLPTTVVPLGGTAQFHAVGTFSNDTNQDITNNSSTNWTTTDAGVVIPNTSGTPGPGSYYAAGYGTATINASSGGISGPGAAVEVTATTTPSATPSATPTP